MDYSLIIDKETILKNEDKIGEVVKKFKKNDEIIILSDDGRINITSKIFEYFRDSTAKIRIFLCSNTAQVCFLAGLFSGRTLLFALESEHYNKVEEDVTNICAQTEIPMPFFGFDKALIQLGSQKNGTRVNKTTRSSIKVKKEASPCTKETNNKNIPTIVHQGTLSAYDIVKKDFPELEYEKVKALTTAIEEATDSIIGLPMKVSVYFPDKKDDSSFMKRVNSSFTKIRGKSSANNHL